jgi:hypothetical protein
MHYNTYHCPCLFCNQIMADFQDDAVKSKHYHCLNKSCPRSLYILMTDQYVQASFNVKGRFKIFIFFDDFNDNDRLSRIIRVNVFKPSGIESTFLFEHNDLNIFDSDDILISKIESLALIV